RQRVRQLLMPAGLGGQLAVALPTLGADGALPYRGLHGAALLHGVRAIAETALSGKCRDLLERAIHTILAGPELQFAQPGRVDECAALRERQQLAARRGVAAAAVGWAHLV